MHSFSARLLFVAAPCVLAGAADAAITAEYLPAQYNLGTSFGLAIPGVFQNIGLGQSFLAHQSGALESITIDRLYFNPDLNANGQPLHIAVYTADASNVPAGAALSEWDVAAADITPFSLEAHTFLYGGPTVSIIAGNQYAFMLSVATPTDDNAPFSAGGTDTGYTEGAMIRSDAGFTFAFDGYDIGFQVAVVIPTPMSAAPLAMLAFAGARRRSR